MHDEAEVSSPGGAFNRLNGYTDKQLFKDVRFKIGVALHASGLAHTDYAKSIVASLAPRPLPPYEVGAS